MAADAGRTCILVNSVLKRNYVNGSCITEKRRTSPVIRGP